MDAIELIYRMRRAGHTQVSLARELGITRSVVNDVIHGRKSAFRVATCIADVVGAELAEELAGLVLYPEVEAVLDTLRQVGRRVAVCSNLAASYGAAVRELLPGLDAYILSYEVGTAKPDPAIYEAVCSALERCSGEVLFIGDSQRCDLLGPQAFGMSAHWLDRASGQTLWDVLARKPHEYE